MKKKKLLVVDDEARILTSIQDLFEEEFEVVTTTDPREALRLIEEHAFAVVISDQRMPQLTGHQLLGKVKEHSKATRVLMTGYTDANALTLAINEGQIFAYVNKPWEPLELRVTVLRALEHFELAEALTYERSLLLSLMDNIPDPIYFKDVDSRCIRVNHAQARLFGVSDALQCVGKTDSEFLPFEYARAAYEDEQNVLTSGLPLLQKLEELRKPDGSVSWFSTTKVPIRDNDGTIKAVAGVSRDITKLKRAEEALRSAHDKLQSILNTAGEGICGLDHSGRITFINPSAAKMIGWEANQLIGMSVHQIAQHSTLDGSPCSMEQGSILASLRDGTDSHAGADALWKKDGTALPVEYTIASSTGGDGSRSAVVTFRDITERKAAELNLRKATEIAEAANGAKSEFLARMSHEMRTPLNALLGIAGLLLETPLNSEQQEYVSVFRRAGANLLDLVNDILNLSKVESGRLDLETINFDLGTVLERTRELLCVRAQEKGIQLVNQIEEGTPAALVGDANRLQQILVNLIGNAIKFTNGGEIIVHVGGNPDQQAPGSLRFEVSDTGMGIPNDKLEVIFENFTQADSSITRQHGGTGLGLSISKKFVERMNGRIWAESELGRGSTFYFTAEFGIQAAQQGDPSSVSPGENLAADPAQAVSGTQGQEDGRPALRVLVVEDSRDNLFLLRSYLKSSRFQLDEAENGQIALDKFKAAPYDLVLMDVQMPVMDGYAATRAIRQWERRNELRPAPILALTAHAFDEECRKSLDAGCTAHLTKPIDKQTLLRALEEHTPVQTREQGRCPGGKICISVPKGLEELIPGFLENREKDVHILRSALERNDYDCIRLVGHNMKGAGTGYGFEEITNIGRSLEQGAKSRDSDAIVHQVAALSKYLLVVQDSV